MEYHKFRQLSQADKKKALFSLSNQMGAKKNEAYFASLLDIYLQSLQGIVPHSYYSSESSLLNNSDLSDFKDILVYFNSKNVSLFLKEKTTTSYYDKRKSITSVVFNCYQNALLYSYKDKVKVNHSLFLEVLSLAKEMNDAVHPKELIWNMHTILHHSPIDKINPVFDFLVREYSVSILNTKNKGYYGGEHPIDCIIKANRRDYYEYLQDNDPDQRLISIVKKSIYDLEQGVSPLYQYIVEATGIEKEKKYMNKIIKKVKTKKEEELAAPKKFKI